MITHVNILYVKGSKHDEEIGNEFNALYEKIIIKKNIVLNTLTFV